MHPNNFTFFYFSEDKPKNRIQTVIKLEEEMDCFKCMTFFCCFFTGFGLCCLHYCMIHNETFSSIWYEDLTKTCQRCQSNRKATKEDVHNYKVEQSKNCGCLKYQ